MAPHRRSRALYALLLLLTIELGLASRHYSSMLPRVIAEYAGDTLWAAMVVWLLALAFPRNRTVTLAAGAFAVSVAVEISQLVRAPWLEAVRSTRLGALVLGHGFLWSDLLCYALGASGAALLDWMLVRRQMRSS